MDKYGVADAYTTNGWRLEALAYEDLEAIYGYLDLGSSSPRHLGFGFPRTIWFCGVRKGYGLILMHSRYGVLLLLSCLGSSKVSKLRVVGGTSWSGACCFSLSCFSFQSQSGGIACVSVLAFGSGMGNGYMGTGTRLGLVWRFFVLLSLGWIWVVRAREWEL